MSSGEVLAGFLEPSTGDGGESGPEVDMEPVHTSPIHYPTTALPRISSSVSPSGPNSANTSNSRGQRSGSHRKKYPDETKQRTNFQTRPRGFHGRGTYHAPTSRHVDHNLRVTLFQDKDTKEDSEKDEKHVLNVADSELPKDVKIPTDKLGRVRRGVDVRDYRPQAPRNTSQDLMVRKNIATRIESSPKTKDEIDVQAIQEFGSMVPFHRIIRRKLCDSFSDLDGEDDEDEEDDDEEDLDHHLESEMYEYRDYAKIGNEEVDNGGEPIIKDNGSTNDSVGLSTYLANRFPKRHQPFLSSSSEVEGEIPKRKRKSSLSNDHWSSELPMTGQQDPTSNLLLQWIQEQDETISNLSRENKRLRKELERIKHSKEPHIERQSIPASVHS